MLMLLYDTNRNREPGFYGVYFISYKKVNPAGCNNPAPKEVIIEIQR